MYHIPEDAYLFLKELENPSWRRLYQDYGISKKLAKQCMAYSWLVSYPNSKDIIAADLAREIDIPERSARRYVTAFRAGEFVLGKIPKTVQRFNLPQEYFDLDEFLSFARKLQKEVEIDDPVLNTDIHNFKTTEPIAIMFASCMHLCSRYTDYELFENVFKEMLKVPNLYWASLGDDIEGYVAGFRDKEAVYSQLLNSKHQLIILKKILGQIKDAGKLLFGCGSQHGGKWSQANTGFNPVKQAYLDLDVPFYDGTSYLKLNVGEQSYHAAVSHEFKGSSAWNPNHPQMKALVSRFPMADVVVMGDKHTPAMQKVVAYPDEYKIGNRKSPFTWLLQAGTMKTGMDKYTIANWPTGMFGWPIAVFYPDEHGVDVTFQIKEAQEKMNAKKL